jgi:hypothetical protein
MGGLLALHQTFFLEFLFLPNPSFENLLLIRQCLSEAIAYWMP